MKENAILNEGEGEESGSDSDQEDINTNQSENEGMVLCLKNNNFALWIGHM